MTGLGLLTGIRVVSLEQYIAGPYCTSILADAGAEVTKVERPGSGDPRRTYEPRLGPDDDYVSGGFASYNRGKRSVELDVRREDDHALLFEMLADADVLVCNNRPGSLTRLGLAPEELRTRFPRLVICEITGFGSSGGPYAQWPAFDSVIQAMSGLSSLIGEDAAGPPQLAPMGTMDLLAGVYAAIGILAALVHRSTTGEGAYVDAAMYDIGAAFMERPLTLHEFSGSVPTRGIDAFSPVGAFRSGDGAWISIVIPTDDMWQRCCEAIGRPELVDHPDLDSVLKRAGSMRELVIPLFEHWAADKDKAEAVASLRKAGQPAGIVQSIDEVRRCPQLEHRRLFVEMADEQLRANTSVPPSLPRLPLLVDGRAPRPGPVPRLGEHTAQVRSRYQPDPRPGKETS